MATTLKFRRGNTAFNNAITGAEGEILLDMQARTIRIHDGVQQGGFVISAGAGTGATGPTGPTGPT